MCTYHNSSLSINQTTRRNRHDRFVDGIKYISSTLRNIIQDMRPRDQALFTKYTVSVRPFDEHQPEQLDRNFVFGKRDRVTIVYMQKFRRDTLGVINKACFVADVLLSSQTDRNP